MYHSPHAHVSAKGEAIISSHEEGGQGKIGFCRQFAKH